LDWVDRKTHKVLFRRTRITKKGINQKGKTRKIFQTKPESRKDPEKLLDLTGITQKGKTQKDIWLQPESLKKERRRKERRRQTFGMHVVVWDARRRRRPRDPPKKRASVQHPESRKIQSQDSVQQNKTVAQLLHISCGPQDQIKDSVQQYKTVEAERPTDVALHASMSICNLSLKNW
jgi:hypothetical protein